MAAEMAEQPDVLRNLIARRRDIVDGVRSLAADRIRGVILVARGSSDHAAVYGRYAIEASSGIPVSLAAPSLHTLYDISFRCPDYLAVAISQSGRTPEIVTVLNRLAKAGARSVAITNEPSSPLGTTAQATIPLGAGEERAVPATKTFTSQIAALAFVAEALGHADWHAPEWERIPGLVSDVLADPEPARAAAAGLRQEDGLFVVGRGYLYGAALEIALKLKETSSVLAEGYSAADLRHGPFGVVQKDFPVLAMSVPGPMAADMDELAGWLRSERGARVLRMAPDSGAELPLPSGAPENLAPIVAAARGQQLARELALSRDMDPDTPQGLTKVTPTT